MFASTATLARGDVVKVPDMDVPNSVPSVCSVLCQGEVDCATN